MKVAILGFGREGKSVLKFIKRHPRYKNSKIEILDRTRDKNYLKNLSSLDLVFRSPGVPYNLPEIKAAIKKGVEFSSSTKLFFDFCQSPIIGITGTKGKGTTSTLLYQILKNWQKSVSPERRRRILLAGNIGKPALEILHKADKNTLVILELSSFQLQDLEKSPHIAVITDVFPDHLDVHKNMKEYIDSKSNIVKHQKKSDVVFYFKDNLLSRVIAKKSAGNKIGISGNPHGLKKNHVMAASIAAHLGCPQEKITSVVKKFKGIEHRMEFVRKVMVRQAHHKNKSAIYFYNDSASTNPQTASMAVLSLSKDPIILIAGGKDKNLDYKPLAEAIKKSRNVKEIILIGENKNKIQRALHGIKNHELRITNAADLKSAVDLACRAAQSIIHNSCFIVLFSPGAASFDMFKDYKDRGEQYKKAVLSLKKARL